MTTTATDIEKQFLEGKNIQTTARSNDDLIKATISCAKDEREALKANDKKAYTKLMEQCSAALKGTTFQLIQPFDAKTVQVDSLKRVISVVTQINTLKERLMRDDTINVFNIPSKMSFLSGYWEPANTCTSVNLLTSYKELDLETVKRAVAWYKQFGQSYHVENCTWSGDLILNSCKEDLRLKIVEACKDFDEAEKGGPTYFFLLMKYIVATSETALRGLTSALNKLRLKDFDGENVLNCVSFVKSAITLLKDNSQLPNDIETTIYEIFGSSSCTDFNNLVGGYKLSKTLKLKTVSIDEILTAIETDYQDKIGNQKWPAKDTKQESSFLAHQGTTKKKDYMCDNCGALNKHELKDCTEVRDEAAIKARRAIRNASTQAQGGGKRNHNSTNTNNNNNNNNDTKNSDTVDPKKVPPKAGEAHEKNFKNKKHYWCGKCGRWVINHKTATHKTKEQLAEAKDNSNKSDEDDANAAETAGSIANIGGASCLNF